MPSTMYLSSKRRTRASICVGALIATQHVWALSPQEVFVKSEPQVLVLEVLDRNGETASVHTALVFSMHQAVTQCDLLENGSSCKVRTKADVHVATVGKKDTARNLCLLDIRSAKFSHRPELAAAELSPGSRVYALTNALGLGIGISEGVVSAVRRSGGESFIQFTSPIAPGSEGGGLFDAEGRLVGIINYRHRDGQNVNFALPARWLGELEQRTGNEDTVESWRAACFAYDRQKDWPGLAKHAAAWTISPQANTEAWLWLAYAEEQKKNWQAAAVAYREALQRDSASTQAGLGLANALLQQGATAEALAVSRGMLAYRTEDTRIWFIIGRAQGLLGQHAEARQSFERSIQLDPWNRDAYAGLVALARERGDAPSAVAAQRQIVRIAPENAQAWAELASDYLMAGRAGRALASANRALEISAHADAWIFKGAALHGLKRHRESIEAYKRGLTMQPSRPALGWIWLGQIYYDLGLFAESISAFREALQIEPRNYSAKAGLGIALKDNFEFDEALRLFEEMRIEKSDDPFAWRQIGFVHSYLGKWEPAIAAYRQSLKLDSKQAKVWRALMESYHALDRRDEVKSAYRKLLAVDRDWAEKAHAVLLLPYGDAP